MIVTVNRFINVVNGDRANESLVKNERTHERRLKRSLCLHPGCFKVGTRTGVHQWTMIASDPPAQAVAVRYCELLHRFGLDASRKPAAQCLAFLAVKKQRIAGERHNGAQRRTQESHGVSDSKAATNRLSN